MTRSHAQSTNTSPYSTCVLPTGQVAHALPKPEIKPTLTHNPTLGPHQVSAPSNRTVTICIHGHDPCLSGARPIHWNSASAKQACTIVDRDNTKRLEEILAMSRALLASMDHVISTVPDSRSAWHFSSFRDYALQYNRLARVAAKAEPSISPLLFLYDEEKMPNLANTLHIQQHSLFQNVHGSMSMLCALIGSTLGEPQQFRRCKKAGGLPELFLAPSNAERRTRG